MQLKKRLWNSRFPVNNAKFLRTPFSMKQLLSLPPVNLEPSLWNQQHFSSSYFDYTWYYGLPLHCDKIAAKRDIHRKIFVVVFIHLSIQTSEHLNWNKNNWLLYVLNRRSFPAFSEWMVLWNCFQNDFWMSVKNTSL